MIKYLLRNGFVPRDGGEYYKDLGEGDYILLVPEMNRLVVDYKGNMVSLHDCDSVSRMRVVLRVIGYNG